MSSPRVIRFLARALVLGVLPAMAGPLLTCAVSAQAIRLVDGDGIIHVTNVPADPRYRGLAAGSGTTAGWLRLSTGRPERHVEVIREISREHGLDPVLVQAVVGTESGFDPAAVSPKGAGGLMQLMPGTAAALGVVDRFNPRENISGGVRHLRYLLDRYQGSVAMALAAYNAGEGVVDTYRGIPPYPETQRYVRRVLRDAGLSEATGGTPRTIYRYRGPDDTLTYSNIPPAPGRGKEHQR